MIRTAEEFFKGVHERDELITLAKAFAKMHVTEALKEASESAELDYYEGSCSECQSNKIDKKSILNTYPLTNIK